MEDKLNIFDVLTNINRGNRNFYDNLSETHKNNFQPFVVQKWLIGSDDDIQTLIINETINRFVFNVKDKTLLYDLCLASSPLKTVKYKWSSVKKSKSQSLARQLVKEFYDYSDKELNENFNYVPKQFILDLGMENLTKKEYEALKKELNG